MVHVKLLGKVSLTLVDYLCRVDPDHALTCGQINRVRRFSEPASLM